MELASNLKRLRKAAGYTQEALAEKLYLTGLIHVQYLHKKFKFF